MRANPSPIARKGNVLRKIQRRSFGALCGLGLLASPAGDARAQAYPARPVRFIVPYPAGGATDVVARLLSEKLTTKWGQPVVVENRAGAGATIGAQVVAQSAPDGYTLFETTSAHTISASLYRTLPYNPIRDFTAITLTATVPLVMVTAKSVPANTLQEFIAWAKAQPQGVTVASTGNGTAQHLTAELFKGKTGITSEHVPYRGDAPMITDLLGGLVQFAFATLSAVLPYINSGELKAIALAHGRRMSALPNVPTFAEAGMAEFEFATWFGTFAPAGLPGALRERIYQDISGIVADPAMTRRLVEMGAEVNNLAPAQFDAFIQQEAARWAEAVRISGAQIN
ncbi:tripartite tricarboxylate transporter substrate binding protein [Roseomonas hellenica]|uniref:Tripartite tricarboxylate transporter substrate binding protein n=1 Tax=Plastoroseomonas hellenica TaxID=2687306 RepID=A0ABS5ERF1_9PROT|nr:tripartite tricarboxylate transporter substrate binding protein [Plastoroseomonas hellenica]